MVALTTVITQSPGVYVSEEKSAAPIAGVGTSTAGFIGLVEPVGATTRAIGSAEAPVDIAVASANQRNFPLPESDIVTEGDFGFLVDDVPNTDVKITKDGNKFSATFTTAPGKDKKITGYYKVAVQSPVAAAPEVKVCTNFTEFKDLFGVVDTTKGDASKEVFIAGQPNLLAHAVLGFFRNGGTRCYVARVASDTEASVGLVLDQFEAIDEIAIVAAPGLQETRKYIADNCALLGDRVAILDGPPSVDLSATNAKTLLQPFPSDYAALYFPWLLVFDPAAADPKVPIAVPPSGHVAGIYARVDSQRGVFKAPANEVVVGATALAQPISKRNQDTLNEKGINCIRNFNGDIRVWGARTLGGEANGEFKYISTRRLFNYLKESIDEGTQWTVFEPNSPELWAKIRRSVTAFLTVVWRSGALFGSTPEEAFYVKCDAENNPPNQRELGLVVTDIGVAVVKPAEFVVFRLSQRQDGQ
ncbi:phage tail sheath family protein [Nodosilinea sp. FACHB-131]|uniref:phage tail sheath family protein n=1 Tax=Cyanophyceae TaxID=3028117 RepID=UPI001683DD60|nr:phage tail sheath subtilisin-like domain-containing protein [Nodosilinea sp. FACHB-131]MBD1873782.1 phage tail sheath family protein [Nodosilinea sp. FACHB-131]